MIGMENAPLKFKIADQIIMGNLEPLAPRATVYRPMPRIQSSDTIQGPLRVTEEFKRAHEEKVKERMRKDFQEGIKAYEKKIIDQLAKKARYQKNISKLNPNDPKEHKKIVVLNFKIRRINEKLEILQKESGINLNNINTGSRLERFINFVKETATKIVKKVKKFFKRNYDIIMGVASIVLPFFGAIIMKKLFGA